MLTLEQIKKDEEIKAFIAISEQELGVLGYTEHSDRHLSIVSKLAGDILQKIGASERETHLARVSGYLHDIGNALNRVEHAQSGAILAYNYLIKNNYSHLDAAEVMLAIGNHDEQNGVPVSKISASLILADKSDVHRTRVRGLKQLNPRKFCEQDIHDRVNYAAEFTNLLIDNMAKTITLQIKIDTHYCSVMDYFEIYFSRMSFCKRAAAFLGYKYGLEINNATLL